MNRDPQNTKLAEMQNEIQASYHSGYATSTTLYKKTKLTIFNRQNAHTQFTKEIEENGKILFPDSLVIRENNRVRMSIYKKHTETDRLFDEFSYNPTSHKHL